MAWKMYGIHLFATIPWSCFDVTAAEAPFFGLQWRWKAPPSNCELVVKRDYWGTAVFIHCNMTWSCLMSPVRLSDGQALQIPFSSCVWFMSCRKEQKRSFDYNDHQMNCTRAWRSRGHYCQHCKGIAKLYCKAIATARHSSTMNMMQKLLYWTKKSWTALQI